MFADKKVNALNFCVFLLKERIKYLPLTNTSFSSE